MKKENKMNIINIVKYIVPIVVFVIGYGLGRTDHKIDSSDQATFVETIDTLNIISDVIEKTNHMDWSATEGYKSITSLNKDIDTVTFFEDDIPIGMILYFHIEVVDTIMIEKTYHDGTVYIDTSYIVKDPKYPGDAPDSTKSIAL